MRQSKVLWLLLGGMMLAALLPTGASEARPLRQSLDFRVIDADTGETVVPFGRHHQLDLDAGAYVFELRSRVTVQTMWMFPTSSSCDLERGRWQQGRSLRRARFTFESADQTCRFRLGSWRRGWRAVDVIKSTVTFGAPAPAPGPPTVLPTSVEATPTSTVTDSDGDSDIG